MIRLIDHPVFGIKIPRRDKVRPDEYARRLISLLEATKDLLHDMAYGHTEIPEMDSSDEGKAYDLSDLHGHKILQAWEGARLPTKLGRKIFGTSPYVYIADEDARDHIAKMAQRVKDLIVNFICEQRSLLLRGWLPECDSVWQHIDFLEKGVKKKFGSSCLTQATTEKYVKEPLSKLEAGGISPAGGGAVGKGAAAAGAENRRFIAWAGGERVTKAIVFTDVVGSTALRRELRDERMMKVLEAHFKHGQRLVDNHKGFKIKAGGDELMAAFHSAGEALDFAINFHAQTGHKLVKIRVGIHIGPVIAKNDDVEGRSVDLAHRVVEAIKGSGIGVSAKAKEDIDQLGSPNHRRLKWDKRQGTKMKGFGMQTLWSLILAAE